MEMTSLAGRSVAVSGGGTELSAPLLVDDDHDVVAAGGTGPAGAAAGNADPLATPGAGAAKGRAALRRAVKRLVNMRKLTSPKSSRKGVPLLAQHSFALRLNATPEEQGQAHDGHDHGSGQRVDQQNSNNSGGGNRAGAPASRLNGGRRVPTIAECKAAAHFVDDARHGRSPDVAGATRDSILQGGVVSSHRRIAEFLSWMPYRVLFQLVVLAHCCLAFYEHVPGQHEPAFSWSVGVVETFPLLVYVADQVMTLHAFGWRFYLDKKWENVFFVVTVLCVADWLCVYPGGLREIWRFSRPFRPLLSLTKVPYLRRLLSSIIQTVPRIAQVTALFAVFVAFFGVLGMHLFNRQQNAGYDPNNDNFDSSPAAILAVYVLSTTENFPAVMYPSLKYRPLASILYFVSALFVFLWLLLPLVLAIVYDHFKAVKDRLVQGNRVKAHASLVFAYQTLMGGDGTAEMDRNVFAKFVPYCRPNTTREQCDVMFAVLDVDGTGTITIAEFLRLLTVLELDIETIAGSEDEAAARALLGGGSGGWIASFRSFSKVVVQSKWFHRFSWLCILGSSLCALFWSLEGQEDFASCMCVSMDVPSDDDSGPSGSVNPSADCDPDHRGCAWHGIRLAELVALFFQLGALAELAIRSLAHEPKQRYKSSATANVFIRARDTWWIFESSWNFIDAIIVCWGVIGSVAILAGAHEHLPLEYADVFEVASAFRLLRIVSQWGLTRELLGTLGGVLPLMGSVSWVYVGLMYSFAVVGNALLNRVDPALPSPPLPNPSGLCQACQQYTFNTLPYAFLELLQLTVGNNWNSLLYPNLQGAGSRWYAFYFCAYRFLMMDVLSALIESLMMDAYERQEQAASRHALETQVAGVLAARLQKRNSMSSSSINGASSNDLALTGSGATAPAEGGSAASNAADIQTRYALRCRAELLEEITAVEDAVKESKKARQKQALMRRAKMQAQLFRLGGSGGSSNAAGASSSPSYDHLRGSDADTADDSLSESGGGDGGLGSNHPLKAYGISKEDLDMLERTLRNLESTLSSASSNNLNEQSSTTGSTAGPASP